MSLNLILTQILTPKPTTKQHDIQLNIVAWGMKAFPHEFRCKRCVVFKWVLSNATTTGRKRWH